MKNKKIIGSIFILVILAGILITSIWGLNYSFFYQNHKELNIYIGKKFENQDIVHIVQEVIGKQKVVVQKVELYEDMASIHVKEITEEQLTTLNTKINEKYEIENTIESIEITEIPKIEGRDLIKPYIVPILISFLLILIYLIGYLFFYQQKKEKFVIAKIVGKFIITIIGVLLFYFTIFAITRLPVSRFTIPLGLALYSITTMAFMFYLGKSNSKRK